MKHTIGKSRGLRRVNFSSSPIRAASAAATGRRWIELPLQLAVRGVGNNKTGDEDDNKQQVEGVDEDEGEEITRLVEQNDVISVKPPATLISFLFFCVYMGCCR